MIRINNLTNLDNFIELIQDIAFFKDLDGRYLYFNGLYLDFVQKNREDVINKTAFDFYSKDQAIKLCNDDKNIFKKNQNQAYEEVFTTNDGDVLFFYTSKQIVYDKNEQPIGLFCIVKDITLEKEYETIDEDSHEILEYIAINDDLSKTLDKIAAFAENRFIYSKCSILLLDDEKRHLLSGSAKSLPDFYNDAINGVEIGEKVGSCGSAAFKRERVVVENIDTHENWQPYLGLTQKANLHACWSEPIFSSKNSLLGTFAIYHEVAKYPSQFQLKLISSYANLAAIAIEKENNTNIILAKEHQLLEQSQKSNRELSLLFDNASVGLMYMTGERVLVKVNQRFADILGYENSQEMIGLSALELHLSKEKFIEFGEKNFNSLVDGANYNIEYQLKKKDGSPLWCGLSGKTLDNNTPANLSQGVLWTITDISLRKILEDEVQKRTHALEEMSIRDELTHLYNRKYYNNKINQLLSSFRRYKSKFSIIMYDIDDFKSINDTYGHAMGDKVLIEMSREVKLLLRETDFLFRVGGEEFIILIPNATKEESLVVAQKIRKKVASLKIVNEHKITISLGLTEVEEGDSEDYILQRVDRLLYFSKENGKDRVSTKIVGDITYGYFFDAKTKTLYERLSGNYISMNVFKATLMNEEYMVKYLECENIITDFTDFKMNFEHFQNEFLDVFTQYSELYLKHKNKHLKNKKSASYISKYDNTNTIEPFRALQRSFGVETADFKNIPDLNKFIGFDTQKYFELDESELTLYK